MCPVSKRVRILIWILALAAILSIAFAGWGLTPAQPMPEALAATQSDARVKVEFDRWLVFTPIATQPDTALIIYPGGHVDYRAYAPLAHEISAKGYLVVIVPMPLNLAVLNVDAATEVIAAFPGIKYWTLGGHSLGGAMAANYAFQNPDTIDGLVLWASYSASSDDLTRSGIKVLSVSASLDGLSTPEKIKDSKSRLPVDTTWVVIEGGNHGQFGWYGDQSGDHAATISRQEQQSQILAATLGFLETFRSK
jgi:hypothetical protein